MERTRTKLEKHTFGTRLYGRMEGRLGHLYGRLSSIQAKTAFSEEIRRATTICIQSIRSCKCLIRSYIRHTDVWLSAFTYFVFSEWYTTVYVLVYGYTTIYEPNIRVVYVGYTVVCPLLHGDLHFS